MDDISLFNDMEAIYNFGVSVNWDVEQMRKYGRLYGYNFEIINKNFLLLKIKFDYYCSNNSFSVYISFLK